MSWTIAVAGATGTVGQEILNVLAEREIDDLEVVALATRKSMGVEVSFGDSILKCRDIAQHDFSKTVITIMAMDAASAKEWAPKIATAGSVVIDTSSAFRMDPGVPLIVPEVNAHTLERFAKKNIVAVANGAVAQRLAALKPLHDEARVTRVVATTFQSVSGAGKDAMDELFAQTRAIFVGDQVERAALPKQIAFNVIPQIGDIDAEGATAEETSQIMEMRKVLDPDVKLAVTAVRTPVFVGDAEACVVEFEKPITAAKAKSLLREAPGLILIDRREDGGYVTPVEAVGDFATYVSRVRKDGSVPNGLALWLTSDNLRKGAALNAVQVAETLMAKHLKKRIA
ncbi:MAG: aspartate-semialdehyde dehydrogenase [Micropepsaceae bacterium]